MKIDSCGYTFDFDSMECYSCEGTYLLKIEDNVLYVYNHATWWKVSDCYGPQKMINAFKEYVAEKVLLDEEPNSYSF